MNIGLIFIGMLMASVIWLPVYYGKVSDLEASKEDKNIMRKELTDLRDYYAELERHSHHRR
jgi:hypothetical protein